MNLNFLICVLKHILLKKKKLMPLKGMSTLQEKLLPIEQIKNLTTWDLVCHT